MPDSSASPLFKGIIPAVVTPFSADGRDVDIHSLRSLVKHLIEQGVHGLVMCGSTGEGLALDDIEYERILEETLTEAKGRVPVLAGISASATRRAVGLATIAQKAQAQGLLIATPPYNKPSQEGLIAHYSTIAAAVDLPIVAYNIPSRSAVALLPETVAKLAADGVIVGLKESSGSLETVIEVKRLTSERFALMSGEDSLCFAVLASGGCGLISASANALAFEFVQLYESFNSGDQERALHLQLELLPKIKAIFNETNPVPVKAALEEQGIIASGMPRLPLLPASEATRIVLRAAGLCQPR